MCACDGIEPAEALARSRGGYRRQANTSASIKSKEDNNQMDIDYCKEKTKRKSVNRKKHKKVGMIRDPQPRKKRRSSQQ